MVPWRWQCGMAWPWSSWTLSQVTTSSEASLLRKHITYSITAASHGSVVLPSSLANPNSSCGSIRSSQKSRRPPCRGTLAEPRTAAQPSTQRSFLCQPPTSQCCMILRLLSPGSAWPLFLAHKSGSPLPVPCHLQKSLGTDHGCRLSFPESWLKFREPFGGSGVWKRFWAVECYKLVSFIIIKLGRPFIQKKFREPFVSGGVQLRCNA